MARGLGFARWVPAVALAATAAIFLFGGPRAPAYVLEGTRWNNGTVNFNMGLGSAGRTLIDGNTSWDTAALPVFTSWNGVMRDVQIVGNLGGASTASQNDGVNSIVFASTAFGSSFGSGTLAVTYRYWTGSSTMTGADILFNTHQSFDSYRGNLRFGSGGFSIGDIRRVLIHELGHALGLDHPDQRGQTVDAIMNSVTSNREVPSADDIAGMQAIYGAPAAPTPTPTPTVTPTPTPGGTSHFSNISTRLNVGTGNNVMIAGFIVKGTQTKSVLVRALGPTLASMGVANSLSDPVLELRDSNNAVVASNDDWQTGGQASQISATAYAPPNGNESALIATLAAGSYTAIVQGYQGATGVSLVDVFELNANSTRMVNISTRGNVGVNDNVLIGGLIVSGSTNKSVLIRALGPTLGQAPYSLAGALANPTLELRDASGNLLASNDNWVNSSQSATISASGYAPPNSNESAIAATLSPGNYTAIVRGFSNTTGIALVDAYDLDP